MIKSTSCNYHYYTETDDQGIKHRMRAYKSEDLQQHYNDKLMVKNNYKPENYFTDTRCISKTDSSIDCDSIKIKILSDSKEYACLFTKGVIPCSLISSMQGKKDGPYLIDMSTNKVVIDSFPKNLGIYDMHQLAFIKTGHTKRILKFKITPCTYYIEITNDKADRNTSTREFIENAHLTWFFRSPLFEI